MLRRQVIGVELSPDHDETAVVRLHETRESLSGAALPSPSASETAGHDGEWNSRASPEEPDNPRS